MCVGASYLTLVEVAVIESTLPWQRALAMVLFKHRNHQHLHLWHCSHSCAQHGEERALWLPQTEAHMFIHTHIGSVSSKCRLGGGMGLWGRWGRLGGAGPREVYLFKCNPQHWKLHLTSILIDIHCTFIKSKERKVCLQKIWLLLTVARIAFSHSGVAIHAVTKKGKDAPGSIRPSTTSPNPHEKSYDLQC